MILKKVLAVLSAITLTFTATAGYFPTIRSSHNMFRASAKDTGVSQMLSNTPSVSTNMKKSENAKTSEDGWKYYENDGKITICGYSGSLTKIVVPDTIDGVEISSISDMAFADNKTLTSVDLGSVTHLGGKIFSGCTSLKEITIPKSVTQAGNYYDGCLADSSIETVIFEEGIANIPAYVCKNASKLKNVTIPEKEDILDGYVIEDSAFMGTAITSITIPESITDIQGSVFKECAYLTEIKIPSNVNYIGDVCFEGCKRLASLDLGTNVGTLGGAILRNCESLTEITIPKSVTEAGNYYDGCLADSSIETLIIKPGMKRIPDYLAKNCKTLKTVYFPDTVSEIGDHAFAECTNLEKIYSNRKTFSFSAHSFDKCYKFDDSRFTILDAEETYLIANSDQTSLNGVINYTLKYKLMPSAANAENVELNINIPEGMILLLDSVQSKNLKFDPEDIDDGYISVNSTEGELRFSARVTEVGDYSISANVNFDFNNSRWEQPIGSLDVDCPDITCYTPEKISNYEITVYGITEKNSEVEIYVDDKLLETVESNAYTGKYSATIKLPVKKSGETYSIYAIANGIESNTVDVIYEEYQPEIKSVTMVYTEDHSEDKKRLDITNVFTEGASPVINYYPTGPIVFEIEADNNERIYKMYVTSTKGKSKKLLEAFWNEEKNLWITEGYFDENNHNYIPGSLNIAIEEYKYTEKDDTSEITPDIQLEAKEEIVANSSSEVLEKNDSEVLEKITISDGTTSEDIHHYYGESDSIVINGNKVSASDIAISPSLYGYTKVPYKNVSNGMEYEYYVKPISGNEVVSEVVERYKSFEDLYGFIFVEANSTEGKIITEIWENTIPESVIGLAFGEATADLYGNVGTMISLGGSTLQFYENYYNATDEKGRELAKMMYAYSVLSLATGVALSTVNPALGILWNITTGLLEEYLQDELKEYYKNSGNVRLIIDPSGIVYEAVMSNRIDNAKMTIYYLDVDSDEAVLWNAEDYEQMNPIFTNFDGAYSWDVPEGKWKVVCELEGYETQETEWLDVPPVQTEVNFSLVSKEVPVIKSAEYKEDEIVVTFTKFMDIATITNESLLVDSVKEYDIKPQLYEENDKYTDIFIITGDFDSADNIEISATADCKSYADVKAKESSMTVSLGNNELIPGDTNNDGLINLKDVVILRRFIAGGWDITIDKEVADVNDDMAIDLKDVILIRRYIAGGWNVELK